MVITFCGHSEFRRSVEYEEKILTFLEAVVGDRPTDMYLGGYGEFDEFARDCCAKYKQTHQNVSLVLVTPYIHTNYKSGRLSGQKDRYDSTLYPGLEDKPLRFAITYRNRYMVEQADYVVAFITHTWGGAYTTYKYAKSKGKKILNIAKTEQP